MEEQYRGGRVGGEERRKKVKDGVGKGDKGEVEC